MLQRPLLIKNSKNYIGQRFSWPVRLSVSLGLVLIGVIGTLAATKSGGWKSEEFFRYVASWKDYWEPENESIVRHEEQPVPVKVFVVGSVKPRSSISSLTGVVRARHEINLGFRVNGKIRQRYVEVGESVAKGAPLFDLDPEDYVLQLRNAQANLDVAEATVKRAVADAQRAADLRRANANSESEYERVLSERAIAIGQRESALKQLELARNQLSYCRLSADESGIITALSAEAGQVVTAGFRVAELAQSNELEAVIDIPENRLPSRRPLEAVVRFWSLPGVSVRGRLRELSPVADPMTRTFRGRFTLIEPPAEVKLGMTATVEWQSQGVGDEVAIPATAIFERDKRPAVWVIDLASGALRAQPIELGMVGDQEVSVRRGLREGESIVAAGVQKLDEKLRVRLWEPIP